MKSNFTEVYLVQGSFATISIDEGVRVYTERLVKDGNKEFRIWDPFKSKLCGAMKKGLKTFCMTSGGMMEPLLRIFISKKVSEARDPVFRALSLGIEAPVSKSMAPPFGVASIAFDSKFKTSC